MKTGRIFWGVFFVALGALVFAGRAGWMITGWEGTWRLWPVVLILWGAAMVFHRPWAKVASAAAGALLLALFLASLFGFFWSIGEEFDEAGPITDQEFTEPMEPVVARASFHLESGAGIFTIGDTTGSLLHASTATTLGSYSVSRSSIDSTAEVRLSLSGTRKHHFGKVRNRAEVQLNPRPVWDLVLDMGAARADVDLRSLLVSSVQVNAGSAKIIMIIGDRHPETHINIDAGASSIRLQVPEGSGCEVRIDAPLSNKEFPGFEKIRKGLYQTENFESAAKKVFVDVDAGVSSIRVARM